LAPLRLTPLVMTGYAEDDILRSSNDEPKHARIQKPFQTAELSRQIHALLAS
jgi:hypothetical protein